MADLKFGQLSPEAQLYVINNNVDQEGSIKGLIENANGELPTLLNGMNVSNIDDLLANTDLIEITPTAKNPEVIQEYEKLQNYYKNLSLEDRKKIRENTANEITVRYNNMSNNIKNMIDSATEKNEMFKIKTEFNNNQNLSQEIMDEINRICTEYGDTMVNNLREKIIEQLGNYDISYISGTGYFCYYTKTYPDIIDTIIDLYFGWRYMNNSGFNITDDLFGMEAEEFANYCTTISKEERQQKLELFANKLKEQIQSDISKYKEQAEKIMLEISKNYEQSLTSILDIEQSGDIIIGNPETDRYPFDEMKAQEYGTYKEGNIDLADVTTVESFIRNLKTNWVLSLNTDGMNNTTINESSDNTKKYFCVVNNREQVLLITKKNGQIIRARTLNGTDVDIRNVKIMQR